MKDKLLENKFKLLAVYAGLATCIVCLQVRRVNQLVWVATYQSSMINKCLDLRWKSQGGDINPQGTE